MHFNPNYKMSLLFFLLFFIIYILKLSSIYQHIFLSKIYDFKLPIEMIKLNLT